MTLDINKFAPFWVEDFADDSWRDRWHDRLFWGGGCCGSITNANKTDTRVFNIVQKGGESALEIRMHRDTVGGPLTSGLISNIFPDGSSVANQTSPMGYYEARMWLPDPIAGIWPAFWGENKKRLHVPPAPGVTKKHVPEIDVLEHYGPVMPDRWSTVIHDVEWNWNGTSWVSGTHEIGPYNRPIVGRDVINTGWHTYGVEIGEDRSLSFYFDRERYQFLGGNTAFLYGTAGLQETIGDSPFGWMFNFGAGSGWPIDPELGLGKPAALWVSSFTIYTRIAPDGGNDAALLARIAELEALVASLQAQLVALGEERDDLALQITALNAQVTSLQAQIVTLNAQVLQLNQRVWNRDATIRSLNEQINGLQAQITALNVQIVTLKMMISVGIADALTEVADLKASLTALQGQLA